MLHHRRRLFEALAFSVCVLTTLTSCDQSDSSAQSETANSEPAIQVEPPSVGSSQDREPNAEQDENDHAPKEKKVWPANRLAQETSPYLLMHAHNPVQWYPWGEEALQKAKTENKPIFLSIGYAACHWCHVMEHESFQDEEIANYLNENFICIKVDREERPDVDSIYMTSLHVYNQLTRAGRGGGWPLSMFLTTDAQPFFGGTYFPARDGDRGPSMGFLSVIKRVKEQWDESIEDIKRDADTITQFAKQELEGLPVDNSIVISDSMPKACEQRLTDTFDPTHGGFGFNPADPRRPKFPEPSNLFFLLSRVMADPENKNAQMMLVETLQHMAIGGIQDHIGGGFHRYSVDRFWYIPHFEKMLYDNGQLASVYAEAYKLTGNEEFKQVVVELLDFVARELTTEEGVFYSALDADSEGEEGKFYRWSREEIKQALSEEEYELFAGTYGLNGNPNFEEFYAPQLSRSLTSEAERRKMELAKLESQLAPIRKKLFDVRSKRVRPITDTKILTGWNGLMIRGFADAGRILDNPEYSKKAAAAADFVLTKMRDEKGLLLRTYGNGKAKLNAYINDYAYLIDGLIALHKATLDEKWLTIAVELQTIQNENYWDEKQGGYFFTPTQHETLLARAKAPTDGAQPSGNSVSAENLLYLYEQTEDEDLLQKAGATIQSVASLLDRVPNAAPRMMIAIGKYLELKN